MGQSFTSEEYASICSKVHNHYYDYSLVEYENQNSYVKIRCPKHGVFCQRAGCHIIGKGCRDCAAESRPVVKRQNAAKKFVQEAKQVEKHIGRNYSYERSDYKGAREKLTVTCPIHEDFEVTPNNHLKGRGCPQCAKTGYNRDAKGFLYVMQCENITKIGITNNNPKYRCTKISRSFGKKFSVVWQHCFLNGAIADDMETSLLIDLAKQYKQPDFKFDGNTECFYNVDISALLSRIEELIASQTAAQAA